MSKKPDITTVQHQLLPDGTVLYQLAYDRPDLVEDAILGWFWKYQVQVTEEIMFLGRPLVRSMQGQINHPPFREFVLRLKPSIADFRLIIQHAFQHHLSNMGGGEVPYEKENLWFTEQLAETLIEKLLAEACLGNHAELSPSVFTVSDPCQASAAAQ